MKGLTTPDWHSINSLWTSNSLLEIEEIEHEVIDELEANGPIFPERILLAFKVLKSLNAGTMNHTEFRFISFF